MINFDKTKNNEYTFNEASHTYYWNDKKVETSVTKFIQQYYPQFDTEGLSKKYAEKHGLLQEDVKREWKEAGDISAMAGTIIHSILESSKNGWPIYEDYKQAEEAGLLEQVQEKVIQLKPKAEKFLEDTKDLLTPLATEYTVGLEDKIAGNIDLLAWNNEENEIQIWDYKNTKQIARDNKYAHCYGPFASYSDCNFIHYSMQLSFYKALAQRLLDIKIGKMYLVHFNTTTKIANYKLYEAFDFTEACNKELDKLLLPKIVLPEKVLLFSSEAILPQYNCGIAGPTPF